MKSKIKNNFSVVSGNLLEWFEFSLYGYLATVFAQVFFPQTSDSKKLTSLMLVFSIYAISFVMRPIGGLVLGYFADQHGRKCILITSMAALSVITLCIGILPGYSTIGILAPLFLILLRLIQGFLISAEYVGSTVYQAENNDKNPGFYASLIQSGTFIGGLLASFSVLLLTLFFSHTTILSIGWRIPYFIGSLLALSILYLRIQLPKDSQQTTKKEKLTATWANIFKNQKITLLRAFLIPAAATASVYYFIYEITFLVAILKKSLSTSISIEMISKCCLFLSLPIFAYIGDKIGHKKFLTISLLLLIVFCYPLFYLMTQKDLVDLMIGQIAFALLASPFLSLNMIYVTSLFKKQYRVTASAAMINLSIAVFGATTPVISLILIKWMNTPIAPVFYFLFTCALSLIAIILE